MSRSVQIHRYRLAAAAPLNSRHAASCIDGVLLRVDGGHGCLQPWVALGDPPVEAHLASLRDGNSTVLAARALDCCAADAAARRAGRSLFEGLVIPSSHATLAGGADAAAILRARADGFDVVKLKVGRDWRASVAAMETAMEKCPDLRFRLDFNATLTESLFLEFARALEPGMREAIDFIEDPFEFSAPAWQAAQEQTGLRLAADRWCDNLAAEGFTGVLKPAVHDSPAVLARALRSGRRLVVTSNMDHPVGVTWAAWHAARCAAVGVLDGPCGLCTGRLFGPDAFSLRLPSRGACLVPPYGLGLGFGDLLDALDWENLA